MRMSHRLFPLSTLAALALLAGSTAASATPPPAAPADEPSPPATDKQAEAQVSPAAQEPAAVQPALPAPAPAAAEALPAAPVAPPTGPAPPARVSLFHRHPRGAQPAWVAAANPLAVEAGLEILGKGGNAVDAAVAVQAMLGLVEPQSSGIAGGAFLLYYDGHTRKVSAIDGRERAPAGAQPDMFLDEHGKPLPFVVAVRSGRSTGVPGAIADEIVAATHQAPFPGTMTLRDLSSYRATWAEPLCRPYRGYSVCVPPPPSSGVCLLEMLSMLDRTDIAGRRPTDPQAWFLFAQASRLIYADRDRYVAGPRFVPVPVERLLDPAYVRLRVQLIGQHAGAAPPPGELSMPRGRDATAESAGTSHFVIVDADGNAVSMTTTVESIFGSGRTVRGFVLNNQLTDFSFVPTDAGRAVANAVQGGKRPRSSMSPVIVLDRGGNFVAALGSPGGSAILEYNAKALVGLLAWKLSLEQAIELPNLIARGDTFSGEIAKFPPPLLAGLRERGIELKSGHAAREGTS